MATEILKITDDDDDDDVSILYSTPPPFKSGATKSEAISVDDYRTRSAKIIDLSEFDDVVEIPASSYTKRRRFYKGESSNSKRDDVVLRLSFTCEICADEKPVSDSFGVLGCDHCYCTRCVSNYVAAKLQENITAVGCPVPGCAGFLEPQHCRTILPKEVFERWGDALCEALILGAEKFYCPYKDCSALLIDDGSQKVVQSECPECRRLFCAPCKAAWHSGIQCSEFQQLRADERSNEDIMLLNLAKNKKWIRCPSCRFYVSKSEGCLYMRCRCGYSFCYNCGAQMEKHLHYCKKCRH
ncbi:E3 ubiquitin-protein ligase RSL1 [Salvia miltiorrhiza]|uniref:E3 ubiquitin-protein ligase RSL1 n=1 Tax=Salvia miltiorrhiza TaxID=226208 RepID=UPI0025AD480A|nr:E3 ubiquitin-protein ligase RSL1 [Salvia miltiorrhiza]